MKGFSEYLIISNEEFERELYREEINLEVPFMKEDFIEWLENEGKSKGTITSYISNLKTMDKDIFIFEEDFFEGLKSIVEEKRVGSIDKHFDFYENLISERKTEHIRENGGYTTKRLGDWISTIRSYRKFFTELLSNNQKEENKLHKKVGILPFEERFIEYVEESKSKNTALQYVTYLKRLNKEFFSKVYDENPYIKIIKLKDNSEKALDYITSLQVRLKEESRNGVVSTYIIQHSFDNCRSAFASYAEFISDEILAENVTAEDKTEVAVPTTNTRPTDYDNHPIFNNFKFRLRTQDRLSKNKNVFFPVRMISNLFKLRCKLLKEKKNFFEDWLERCIKDIHLVTNTGFISLSEVEEIEIIPNKGVYALLKKGSKIDVYTHTADNKTMILSVNKLRNIHINHTPLINNVLEENEDKLPALSELTEGIKQYSKHNCLDIENGNFISIFNGLIDTYDLDYIKSITSKLEHDLEFIKDNTTLELMDAKENLKKKK